MQGCFFKRFFISHPRLALQFPNMEHITEILATYPKSLVIKPYVIVEKDFPILIKALNKNFSLVNLELEIKMNSYEMHLLPELF
mmetsp:Transcript_10720/g.7999  ORF Transcript_10720/g.7999 Transcript_10720/m.7999 type:complete len:84 (+) Transcript_10720:371-622(+)